MKKTTFLFALLLITTIGFSQARVMADIESAILASRYPPIINTENNPLIEEVNKLELEYLNLKASQVQNEFANKDLTKLKTKEDIYKAYISYLKKKITEEKPIQSTKIKLLRNKHVAEELNVIEKKKLKEKQ